MARDFEADALWLRAAARPSIPLVKAGSRHISSGGKRCDPGAVAAATLPAQVTATLQPSGRWRPRTDGFAATAAGHTLSGAGEGRAPIADATAVGLWGGNGKATSCTQPPTDSQAVQPDRNSLTRPVGLMDKASASGAGDSRFESWAGQTC